MTQPGQTDGLDWEAHLEQLSQYLSGGKRSEDIWAPFDFVIANRSGPASAASPAAGFVGQTLAPGPQSLSNPKLITEDIMQRSLTHEWNKDTMLRHDPEKLAKIVHGIIAANCSSAADC